MLHKTRGIVLNYIKYGETSIITKIYTEAFGLQSFIQNGVRSSKGKVRMSLFQPLTLLDLVVYYHEGKEIHRINEISCSLPYREMQTEYVKIAITGFLSEVLLKCLRERENNTSLFTFLVQSFTDFDLQKGNYQTFHLLFLIHLMHFLGFKPSSSDELLSQISDHGIDRYAEKQNVKEALFLFFENKGTYAIDKLTASASLDLILNFYQIHIEKFGELKSLRVLREL